jgi:hypothetical protein
MLINFLKYIYTHMTYMFNFILLKILLLYNDDARILHETLY